LLLNPTQNKLFLIRVAEEELLSQKGKKNLTALVHVVKDTIDETARSDSIVYLKNLSQGEVLFVVLINI
jgi:hypothetical protein